jgi:hypothetical protein
MTVEYGYIPGDLLIDAGLALHGTVTGHVTVALGGSLVMLGTCSRDLVVERGGRTYLYGTVCGDVHNRGGRLEVYGTVKGRLHTTCDGETTVDPNAVVRGGTTVDGQCTEEGSLQGDDGQGED